MFSSESFLLYEFFLLISAAYVAGHVLLDGYGPAFGLPEGRHHRL
jgi:hypothetical protein